MDNNSRETLCRVTQNDPLLTKTSLADNNNAFAFDGQFYSGNSDDYSTLGAAIANNTHMEKLSVTLSNRLPLGVADRGFYDGLKSNSSIDDLTLWCNNRNIAGGVGQEILKAYQENGNLTFLRIYEADLQNRGDHVIGDTLRCCRNFQRVDLKYCSITDEQLLPIVDAIRGHRMLEKLTLYDNNIGNVGCDAIATLLIDPNCNLLILNLVRNAINNEGATAIANSLINNNMLQQLYLGGNQIDQSVEDIFSNILCNTSNMNSLYASNHTLNILSFGEQQPGQKLQSLLRINADTNKSHVAIRKILCRYPDIDMEPLFQWDAEGEQTLKALPHIINWFERAEVIAAADDEEGETYRINDRKLSAIFQFAKAMPLLLEGVVNVRVDADKKRKRSDG